MYVYLQPFHTKELIDEANKRLGALGESSCVSERWGFRIRFGVAALSGLAQSVSYFALWVLSSLACFGTLGLWDALDRWSDYTGGLTIASLIGTAMALSSVFKLEAASQLTDKIVKRVDEKHSQLLAEYDKALLAETEAMSSQRKALAKDETYHPEVHFDPAIVRMRAERQVLVEMCRKDYPDVENDKCAAFIRTKKRLKKLSIAQLCELRSTPFSRKELDRFLVQKIASFAEHAMAEQYEYCKQLWATRIREWGQKFDREAFCRNCDQLFRTMKVTKTVSRLVRDVKEADDKEQAYKDCETKLTQFLAEVKARVEQLNAPWKIVQWWRSHYPQWSAYKYAQRFDRYIDPHLPCLTITESFH